MTPSDSDLAVIGCGRTAATLSRALIDAGLRVVALTCRRPESATSASEFLDGAAIVPTNADAARSASLVLLGVPDDALAEVASTLAAELGSTPVPGAVFLHLSGALDAEVLAPLRDIGAAVGSMHPLQTFPDRIGSPRYLAGIAFGIEGDPAAEAAAERLVTALGGHPLHLAPGTKAQYHAAASVAANQLTSLLDLAMSLMADAGLQRSTAMEALMPLILTTLGAIESRGAEKALTGPIARGDADTIRRHLATLSGARRRVYVALADSTVELAAPRLDPRAANALRATLSNSPLEVVASLQAADCVGLAARIARSKSADWYETRLDRLADPARATLQTLVSERSIVTCRPGDQISAPDARALLERALEHGSRWVDCELGYDHGLPRDRLVLSWHGPATGAMAAAAAIAQARPAVGKVVVEATACDDILQLAAIAAALRSGCSRVAVLASGDAGMASRPLARRLGSDWTYACLDDTEKTAPGQLELSTLIDTMRARQVTAASRVFAVTGDPIRHSLSPLVMNRLLPELLGDAVYVGLPATAPLAALRVMRELPLEGLSVTMPLKELMATSVDELSDDARTIGSVNTIVRHGTRLIGHNTDAGAVAEVARGLLGRLDGVRALVLGAGGAGLAAAYGLRAAGADVSLWSRRAARAVSAAGRLKVDAVDAPSDVAWDLVVNATPVGMLTDREATPLDARALTGRAAIDLVYEPRETRLVREARGRGLAVGTGLDVFLHQAREQIRLFTGHTLEIERLREVVG